MNIPVFAAALAGVVALNSSFALAHPHEFVTMRIMARFDETGKVAGLQYHWVHDEFFSAYAAEGQDTNRNGIAEPEELDALLLEILSNIHEIAYFTKFGKAGPQPKFAHAVPISASMIDRKLRLEFYAPFTEPVTLGKIPLSYAIYEDDFYIAMNHDTEVVSVQLAGAPSGCSWTLTPSNPQDELASFAQSLGVDESSGYDLGAQFAEWVSIKCE